MVLLIRQLGGIPGRRLPLISSQVAYLPNDALGTLAANPIVTRVTLDRAVVGAMEYSGATVGAAAVRQEHGYTGAGVGVAIIDSGVTPWHDDLSAPSGGQRVVRFVDFVNSRELAYDDYGHGTHVAGIIAGNGYDSSGARMGIAPAASLIVLKALDANGNGRISSVIAALDYVLSQKNALNIRVVNLSLSTGVYESYNADPLTLATKQLVNAGIVVVTAAGNAGRDSQGRRQYGAIMSPGNAPWVLTVGAFSHTGTIDRKDDTMALFSSRGPTAIDYGAKPDLVAPGVGIESLSDPNSTFYTTKSAYLLDGTVPTSYFPYLSLSGTSMAAPVVAGTVALMLQANPALNPNQVKAILQYSALIFKGYDRLTQGAGFLNTRGAVALARYFGGSRTSYPSTKGWGTQLVWGNRLVRGGRLTASANAWSSGVVWGAPANASGQSIEWGLICPTTSCTDSGWSAWSLDSSSQYVIPSRNVVWGELCEGNDCAGPWTLEAGRSAAMATASDDETVVWGSSSDETVVWGSSSDETVVWGSTSDETVVWGSASDETVVWGSTSDETVVWGSSCDDPACEPVIWNR